MDLQGKTAIVTGAGSGIGRAIAVAFATAGATAVCCGRRREKLEQTAALIGGDGGRAVPVRVDVTRADEVKACIDNVLSTCGRIDVLFNNAGSFQSIAGAFEADPQVWWQDVTVNLLGPFLMSRFVLPHMIARDEGIIINMDGGRPVGGSGYASGKAGLMELTRVTVNELKMEESSVIVLCAGPGLVRTEMTELQAASEAGARWIPSTRQCFAQGKLRRPEEIAQATIRIVQAATPAAAGKYFGPDSKPEDLID